MLISICQNYDPKRDKDYMVYIITRFNTNHIPLLHRKYKDKILFKIYDDKIDLPELIPSENQIRRYKDILHEAKFYHIKNNE